MTTSATNSSLPTVVNEVPETLKHLVLVLAKTFYSPQHYVIMHYLQENKCLREDKMRALLKIEPPKIMKQFLNDLKKDKFITERFITMDKSELTKKYNRRKFAFYHVNYKSILNVTKYKIDHIRQKLEDEEKTTTKKSVYICSGCKKQYDAIDVGQIYDSEVQQLICWNCNNRVVADVTSGPSQTTRHLLAKFNDEMAAIFSMLQQVEGIQFAKHILEPMPDISIEQPQENNNEQNQVQFGQQKFDMTSMPSRSDLYSDKVTVSLNDAKDEQVEAKEAIPWLQHKSYAYEDQQQASLLASELYGTSKMDQMASDAMEVDIETPKEGDADIGILDSLFKVDQNADIGQLLHEFE